MERFSTQSTGQVIYRGYTRSSTVCLGPIPGPTASLPPSVCTITSVVRSILYALFVRFRGDDANVELNTVEHVNSVLGLEEDGSTYQFHMKKSASLGHRI
ncbi:uncharacterized protein AFUA_3G01060 [Aspergillus fumigatus Af293]|uniref:Uncharacterized protein n=1 Tax=Aspergillus fumigatus (strain ATCC MYA-4609 / CBS 101355 / FGSC A1100 / Af293) TaxID=330879 RepID=Q4WFT8_ASPFU|nr:hypothetical protein AFUA_3G01060 [Aspergillus fumigatus Af293]EAL86389.1 hypothetical protein AFUA_3G01060 [Aspergillus fumigatus Af293]